MSFLDFLNMVFGNYQPAYVSLFTQYDEDGYPVDDEVDDDDDDFLDDEEDYDDDDEDSFDDDEEAEWE